MISHEILTNKGRREVNEDAVGWIWTDRRRVYILADGLGGHERGDYASQCVVEHVKWHVANDEEVDIEGIISSGNEVLRKEQKKNGSEDQMKTTLACLCIQDGAATFYHVGDSRIYWFHKNKYRLRSQDHSVPQMLVKSGSIKEKDIRRHMDRNRLIRVMGTEWDGPKCEVSQLIRLDGRESFLLCSDGFWENVEERQMEKHLKASRNPKEWLQLMEMEVLKNGEGKDMDNYSAIAVFVT